jgi:sec-independent protein translocase protein TatB
MFSVPHLVVLFVVVLVFFGPHKLPELARGLGKLMAEFRKASNDFKMAFEEEMRNIERQNREAEWKKQHEDTAAAEKAALPAPVPADPLPAETVESQAPVVSPVSEAVAREAEPSDAKTEEEGRAGALGAQDASDSPAHDHRQPA